MDKNKNIFLSLAAMSLSVFAGKAIHAEDIDWELYGSLRLGVEAVDPDNNPGNFGSYTALRDAYSRFGAKATYAINDDWSLMGQLEVPFDLANMEMQSPYDDRDDLRIAKLQLSGPLGTLWYGRGWLAFYNYIAYPLDYFSSYYSGWATFTTFRRQNTFYYATPSFSGFQLALVTTRDNGTASDNRDQYILSYSNSGWNIAIGRDDLNNGGYAIDGISASYTTGPWYVAAKYEELDYNAPSVYDGDSVSNLLVQYAIDDKNTLRAMVADVGWDYGDEVFHLGWDHQYNDDLKVFAEYYQEETTAAISNKKKSSFLGSPSFNDPADSGGSVITVGVRYDFSTQ
ncbi:MAG: porin [Chromatiales bacterium]|jgi:predicted porin